MIQYVRFGSFGRSFRIKILLNCYTAAAPQTQVPPRTPPHSLVRIVVSGIKGGIRNVSRSRRRRRRRQGELVGGSPVNWRATLPGDKHFNVAAAAARARSAIISPATPLRAAGRRQKYRALSRDLRDFAAARAAEIQIVCV